MTDVFTKEKRSQIMSKIRSKNTKPELKIKKMLRGTYLRFQPKNISGKPDFASKSKKIAVFIDGCFWHGCRKCRSIPESNKEFWEDKIRYNKKRDRKNTRLLKNGGYTVLRFWEHEVNKNPDSVLKSIKEAMDEKIIG